MHNFVSKYFSQVLFKPLVKWIFEWCTHCLALPHFEIVVIGFYCCFIMLYHRYVLEEQHGRAQYRHDSKYDCCNNDYKSYEIVVLSCIISSYKSENF